MSPGPDTVWREQIDRSIHDINLKLDAHSVVTREIQANTSEIIEFFQSAKGGMKTLSWLGAFLKWAGGGITAAVATWAAWKGIK